MTISDYENEQNIENQRREYEARQRAEAEARQRAEAEARQRAEAEEIKRRLEEAARQGQIEDTQRAAQTQQQTQKTVLISDVENEENITKQQQEYQAKQPTVIATKGGMTPEQQIAYNKGVKVLETAKEQAAKEIERQKNATPVYSADNKTVTINGREYGVGQPLPGETDYYYVDPSTGEGGVIAGTYTPKVLSTGSVNQTSKDTQDLIVFIMKSTGATFEEVKALLNVYVNNPEKLFKEYNKESDTESDPEVLLARAFYNKHPELYNILVDKVSDDIWKDFKDGMAVVVTEEKTDADGEPTGETEQAIMLLSPETAQSLQGLTPQEQFYKLRDLGVYPNSWEWVNGQIVKYETTPIKTINTRTELDQNQVKAWYDSLPDDLKRNYDESMANKDKTGSSQIDIIRAISNRWINQSDIQLEKWYNSLPPDLKDRYDSAINMIEKTGAGSKESVIASINKTQQERYDAYVNAVDVLEKGGYGSYYKEDYSGVRPAQKLSAEDIENSVILGEMPRVYDVNKYLLDNSVDFKIKPEAIEIIKNLYTDSPETAKEVIDSVQKELDYRKKIIDYTTKVVNGEISDWAYNKTLDNQYDLTDLVYKYGIENNTEKTGVIQSGDSLFGKESYIILDHKKFWANLTEDEKLQIALAVDNDPNKSSKFAAFMEDVNIGYEKLPLATKLFLFAVPSPLVLPVFAGQAVGNIVAPYTISNKTIQSRIDNNAKLLSNGTGANIDVNNLIEALKENGIDPTDEPLQVYNTLSDEQKKKININYTRRELGLSRSTMDKILAGAMVVASIAQPLGKAVSGVSGLLGKATRGAIYGAGLGSTGLFVATSIPTLIDPKVSVDDKVVALALDVTMLHGLGKSVGLDNLVKSISTSAKPLLGKGLEKVIVGSIPTRGIDTVLKNTVGDALVDAFTRNITARASTLTKYDILRLRVPEELINQVEEIQNKISGIRDTIYNDKLSVKEKMDAVKEVLSPEDYKTVEKLINYVNEIQNIKSNPSDYDNFEFTIVKNADKKIGTANKSLKDYFNKAKIGVYGSTVEYLFKGAIKGIRPNDFDVRIFEDSTIQDKTQIARDLADILRQNGIDAKSEGSSVKVNGEKIFDIHMWDEKFNTTSLMPFDWKQKGYIDNNGVRVVPIEEQAAARVKSIFDKVEAEKTIGTEAGELGVLLPKQLDLPANQRRYENAKIVMRLSDLLAKSESYFRDKGKVSESENVAQILSTLEKQTKSSPILTEEEQKRMIEESFGSSEDFRDMFANAQIEALKYWEKGGKGDFVYKTELGELTIKPTPINKIIPGTLFTVVDNINSFIESIKLTGKVTSGKILEFENGKWIAKDKNIELYTSDELAYDYLVAKFGGADKIPPEAGIVMIRTSPNADIGVKDSGKLISTVKKIEYDTTSDGRKPVVLNELTVRTGGELYPTDKTSLSDKYDIPTGVLETKDPRTGRVYKIIGLATSSAKSEGKGYVPTASQLRTASWMALKGTFSDLLHPHKPSDIVFTDGTTAAKLQGSLFDLFYQDKAKFKIDEELLPDKTIRENVVKEDASWTRKAIDSLKKKLSEFDKDENGFLRLYGEEESNLIKKFKEAKDSTEYDSIVEKEKDNLRKKEIEDLINKNKETREYLDKVSPETKARVLAINLSDLVKPFMIISDSPIADIQEATNLTNLNTIGVSNVKTSSILPSLSVSIPEVSTVPSSEGISTLDVVTKTVIPSTIPSTKTTLTTPTIPTTPKIITVPTTPTTPTTPVIPTEPTIPTTPTTPTIPTIPTNGTPRISTDIIRKIPLSLDEKAKELESMGKLGRVTWQQGALKRGRYGELRKQWYVISYPFKTEKDIIRTFETPSGAVVVNSFGEAFKTIQQLTGSVPNFLLGIDFGAFDLFVSKPSKQGDKGALKFKRDIKQETRLPINVKQIKTIR